MMAAKTGALPMPSIRSVTLTVLTKRSRNSAAPTANWTRAISMPPRTPSRSAKIVSSGSATSRASTLGRTSMSSGGMPMVRMASISSVTAMVPICAA
ncbi:hypothetical protein D3C73_1549580 [compost metagenome]